MNGIVWISGAVAVISTLAAVTRRNAVHALLYLIVGMLGVAVVLFAFGAAFAASAIGGVFGALVLFASLPILSPLVLS